MEIVYSTPKQYPTASIFTNSPIFLVKLSRPELALQCATAWNTNFVLLFTLANTFEIKLI
uniref:Uncharacterized protein n=1 Tax=Meloidogyne enterolobii TaxID=390850 RepID=A0A6V7VC31_MELEN|nr:unnamed protein product [Meloidogyne enterolobii]